jgi:DNA-binding CsgD family transcriptional regulator
VGASAAAGDGRRPARIGTQAALRAPPRVRPPGRFPLGEAIAPRDAGGPNPGRSILSEKVIMRILHPSGNAMPFPRLGHTSPAASTSPATLPLAQRGDGVIRALDLLRVGLAFFDLDERPVHANAMLRRVLADQPDGEEIRREIRRFTESVGALVRQRHAHDDDGMLAELAERDFRTSEGSYLLRGGFVQVDDDGGHDGMLLVALEPAGAEFLSADLLQSRYSLTSREVRVARLVTLGHSDAEIAAHLCISLHTARHHTEHLRQKLGVCSRGEVAAHVLRVGCGSTGGAAAR